MENPGLTMGSDTLLLPGADAPPWLLRGFGIVMAHETAEKWRPDPGVGIGQAGEVQFRKRVALHLERHSKGAVTLDTFVANIAESADDPRLVPANPRVAMPRHWTHCLVWVPSGPRMADLSIGALDLGRLLADQAFSQLRDGCDGSCPAVGLASPPWGAAGRDRPVPPTRPAGATAG